MTRLHFTEAPLAPFGNILLDTTIPTSYADKVRIIHRAACLLRARAALPRRRVNLAEMCLDEAINNAIEHGNRGDPKKTIRLWLFADAERWGAIVADEGGGFGPEDVPDPTTDENLLREGGRGIALMEGYLDELRYHRAARRLLMAMRVDGE